MSEFALEKRLHENCVQGNIDSVKALVEKGADPCWVDAAGQNSLIVAAKNGHLLLVEWLLTLGVPWNALDKEGCCAGDYAFHAGHTEIVECLLTAGCQAEMILGVALKQQQQQQHFTAKENDLFLTEPISFTEDQKCILDRNGEAVMMDWESPLMEAHAEALCVHNGDVLNIGFGLGLIDKAIQKRMPNSHTIIEAHPQIYSFMLKNGWDQIPGVKIIHGKWQDVIDSLPNFDSVFFDTYGEHYSDLQYFHSYLPKLMKPDGVYSFFNGLAPDNGFFHLVYCEIVKMELEALGFTTQFVSLPLNVGKQEIWKYVKHRYFWNDTYHLPVAQYTSLSS